MTQVLEEEGLEQIRQKYAGKTIWELERILKESEMHAEYLKNQGNIQEYLLLNSEVILIEKLIATIKEESRPKLDLDEEDPITDPEAAKIEDRVTLMGEYGEEEYILVRVVKDPSIGELSIDSPIGSQIYGQKKGHIVVAQTPGGLYTATLIGIDKSKAKAMTGLSN